MSTTKTTSLDWVKISTNERPAPGRYLVIDKSFAVCSALVLPKDFRAFDDDGEPLICNPNGVMIDCIPPVTYGEADDHEYCCVHTFCTENPFFPTHYAPFPRVPTKD